jgi:DNA-directed RNA polymerase subunit RPC12/RpoP
MGIEEAFAKLADLAPQVECPGCKVVMRLRTLVPAKNTQLYTAMYRCPKCGTETQREFTSPDNA